MTNILPAPPRFSTIRWCKILYTNLIGRDIALPHGLQSTATNLTQTGAGASPLPALWELGGRYFDLKQRNVIGFLVGCEEVTPTWRYLKCRGVLPPVGTISNSFRVPVAGSIAKLAMLS